MTTPANNCACGGEAAAHHHGDDAHVGCACQQVLNAAPLTAEEQAALARDPVTAEWSAALRGGFLFLKLAMGLLLLFFVLDRFRSVNEGEVMVVERFGALRTDANGEIKIFTPGKMYFLFPAPFDRPLILRTAEVKELALGLPFVARESTTTAALDPQLDGYNLTGDLNLIHTEWKVKYRITDYRAYLAATADPEILLSAIVRNAIVRHFAAVNVETAYYGDSRSLLAKIDETINRQLTPLGIALDGGIANTGIRPPSTAIPAFNQVTGSLSERRKLTEEAQRNAAQIAQEAATAALAITNDALHYRTATTARARADAVRWRELTARFANDPAGLQLYLTQYRYDRVRAALATAKLYFLRDGANIFWTTPTVEYGEK